MTLSKTADEAKQHWRTEEKNQAMFGYGDRGGQGTDQDRQRMGASSYAAGGQTGTAPSDDTTGTGTSAGTGTSGGTNLNRSFSGTY